VLGGAFLPSGHVCEGGDLDWIKGTSLKKES
jgi:hypothetical protein